MTSEECTIEVHVRRTGESILVKVIPMVTTFGDIIKIICQKMNEPEPSHFYITMNYAEEMEDHFVFQQQFMNQRFQMIMRTKWLLEFIAEQQMGRQYVKLPSVPVVTNYEIPQRATTTDVSIRTSTISQHNHSKLENADEQKRVILGDVVRSTIKRIPRQDVQKYLHKVLNKSFDILLMGSPRVGKSTLINAILKKSIAKTSAGKNACTSVMTCYEYEESYTSSADDKPLTCSIRVWDAPGIEDWTQLDITEHLQSLLKEKNPICLIYCASPGSSSEVEHTKIIIEQCKQLDVFIALVVTNMYASDEADVILDTFRTLLTHHSIQTGNVDDVYYYGTVGLCAAVNSVEYVSHGKTMKPAGVDELMIGIMNSLSEEKLLQWCFALMDNGPFWIRAQSRIWKTFNSMKRWFGY